MAERALSELIMADLEDPSGALLDFQQVPQI
jgi:hypothetical protein